MGTGHLRPVPRRDHPAQGQRSDAGGVLDILLDDGYVTPEVAGRAVAASRTLGLSVDRILLNRRQVAARSLAASYMKLTGAAHISLKADPPDPRLIDQLGAGFCLRHGLTPWKTLGRGVVIVVDRPDTLERHRPHLEQVFGHVTLALATQPEITAAILNARAHHLVQAAEARVDKVESCRSLPATGNPWVGFALLSSVMLISWAMPTIVFSILCFWAVLTLVLNTCLKTAAGFFFVLRKRNDRAPTLPTTAPTMARQPVVSIMVPLYREREIATHLIARLRKLKYPRDLLDVILVTEADDVTTRDTLRVTRLPNWMRSVVVPPGAIKTKPRALNYALDHARGSIIGVYDAEDAPDPHQILDVVARFAERGPEVACLQGILDFYNARTNWLSRCFAVEYATWFRVILPGLERLGFAVPLGGTTLFFRRDALENLGAWDAHNVTEDADLGIRLARHGYRVELINTVTEEEANCRAWPWVKQRSRWLKGYAMTWAVHMRNPAQLWHDLGAWRFFGVQLLFLGTLSQFILAPVLWSFWLLPLGLPHPLLDVAPIWLFWTLGGMFLLSELLGILVASFAVADSQKTHLIKWVPTLHFYFPLGAAASYKAVLEVFTRPFYWDKTAHGVAMGRGEKRGRWQSILRRQA